MKREGKRERAKEKERERACDSNHKESKVCNCVAISGVGMDDLKSGRKCYRHAAIV